MINIDKEKINENINEAYNNQTEKVKELLESAKKNLADLKECPYDYKTSKENANKFHTVSRVVTKKKENENRIDSNINSKFEEMNKKLEINSKNLDTIFENVTQNNKRETDLLEDISEKQEDGMSKVIKAIKKVEKENLKNRQSLETTQSNIINSQVEIQNVIQNTLVTANTIIENNILEGKKQVDQKIEELQATLEEKINKMQKQNEQGLYQVQEEILKTYKAENKHAINTLLEERSGYLKELEEKDKEIRQLNYKIYEYQEKLEKEIAKRERLSIFAAFFRKEEVQEEEPIFTSQILNYIYQ